MGLKRQTLVVTTDSAGAGTISTQRPLGGCVIELRNDSAAWGGTADYTFTRAADEGGGTVFNASNLAGPFSVYPGGSVYGLAGVASHIPVDGQLTMTIAQAGSVVAGTVHVFYESE